MSGPYSARDLFETPKGYEPLICDDPDCEKMHNEETPDGEYHHYECECGWCQYVVWSMK